MHLIWQDCRLLSDPESMPKYCTVPQLQASPDSAISLRSKTTRQFKKTHHFLLNHNSLSELYTHQNLNSFFFNWCFIIGSITDTHQGCHSILLQLLLEKNKVKSTFHTKWKNTFASRGMQSCMNNWWQVTAWGSLPRKTISSLSYCCTYFNCPETAGCKGG